jgi:hypothetical protein
MKKLLLFICFMAPIMSIKAQSRREIKKAKKDAQFAKEAIEHAARKKDESGMALKIAIAKCGELSFLPEISRYDAKKMLGFWDFVNEQRNLNRLPEPQYFHQDTIKSLAFSPNSGLLAVASLDKTTSLWLIKTQVYTNAYSDCDFMPIILNTAGVSLSFSANSDFLYTKSPNGRAQIWATNMQTYANK